MVSLFNLSSLPFLFPFFSAVETARASFPLLSYCSRNDFANRLDAKDFCNLDAHRHDDLAAVPPFSSILDNLSSALFCDGAAFLAKAKFRYIDMGAILRLWTFCGQVHDIVQPGVGKYLLRHLNELFRISCSTPATLGPF